jgi:ABC-type dipeptide/oligopeptide/nickel transport system permease subunit
VSFEYPEAVLAADEMVPGPGNRAEQVEYAISSEVPWRRTMARFRRNLPAMIAFGFIVLVVLVAIFAPMVQPQSPSSTSSLVNTGPSAAHWLGTDDVGRDMLSRLIQGTRASMQVAFQVVIFATIVALPLGLIAGYFGGRLGGVIMRCMDALFTFPALTLALAVAALLGASLLNASIAIAIVFVPGLVRLVRAQSLAVREETFIEASRSVGVGSTRMLRKHVFPNVASPMIVQLALAFGYAVGAEAGLSFLGFGVQPPTASWGTMLQSGYNVINEAPWAIVPPGLALLFVILAFNLVGDGLRDALGRERFSMGA